MICPFYDRQERKKDFESTENFTQRTGLDWEKAESEGISLREAILKVSSDLILTILLSFNAVYLLLQARFSLKNKESK